MSNILLIAHIQDGEVKKSTNCTASLASRIAGFISGKVDVLALGDNLSKAKEALCQLGAGKVLLAEAPGLDQCLPERWAPIIEQVVRSGNYQVVLCPASSTGKDVMPRAAARLQAGMASDIVGVTFEGGKLCYSRTMFAGNVNAVCQIATPIQMVTVRATEFAPLPPTPGGTVENVTVPPASAVANRVQFLGVEKSVSSRPDLSEAKVVIAGGRGLKSKENFELLEKLADLLGGAVGGTRAAVDAGFIGNDFQVGQTGKIVAPELYIAVGLSGALQHVAGMKSSKVVVAINKDEEAPILQMADYSIVADLFKVIPELTEEVKRAAK